MAAVLEYDKLFVELINYVYEVDVTQDVEALCIARLSFFDALGCASESLATNEDCRKLIGHYVPGTRVPNGFRLPGTSLELDPVKGAFDFGLLIRYLDRNDGFTGLEWGHPSGNPDHSECEHSLTKQSSKDNIGAICAIADFVSQEARNKRDHGPTIFTILTMLIKAYEIQGRLQLANSLNKHGLDHVFFEKLATCAVICGPSLLNLTKIQALSALSHCVLDNAPLRAYRHAPNTIPRKGWAGGDAVSRAVQLALIARNDQRGAPTALSAERWGFEPAMLQKSCLTQEDHGNNLKLKLGGPPPQILSTYVIRNTFFKLMPCEAHALTAVEACILLRQRLEAHKILWDPRNVKRVSLRTHAGAVLIISKPATLSLSNPADRDHCLEYMMAVALLKGAALEYCDYSDNAIWVHDDQVDCLRRKIVVKEDEGFSRDYHDPDKRSLASGVTVEFFDGSNIGEVVIEHPLGSLRHPDTVKAVKYKFYKSLSLIYSGDTVERMIDAVENNIHMPARDFLTMLWKGVRDP